MMHRDYLWCALNLILDDEEQTARLCPACRAEAGEERCPACGERTESSVAEENSSFDSERYERLRGGGVT